MIYLNLIDLILINHYQILNKFLRFSEEIHEIKNNDRRVIISL
jgi:hypothetical protein